MYFEEIKFSPNSTYPWGPISVWSCITISGRRRSMLWSSGRCQNKCDIKYIALCIALSSLSSAHLSGIILMTILH